MVLAFTAGVFTVFSPCSFPLLPGYFIYRLTISSSRQKTVLAGFICSLGLISVFSVLALLLSLAGAILSKYIGALPLIAGMVMIVMGVFTLVGQGFSHSPLITRIGRKDDVLGTFGYGIVYGFASTGCSAPIFYSLVLYAVSSRGLLDGAIAFLVYAFGIGLPFVVISVLVGFGRAALLSTFTKATPMIRKTSGILLIAFGLYQIYSDLSTP